MYIIIRSGIHLTTSLLIAQDVASQLLRPKGCGGDADSAQGPLASWDTGWKPSGPRDPNSQLSALHRAPAPSAPVLCVRGHRARPRAVSGATDVNVAGSHPHNGSRLGFLGMEGRRVGCTGTARAKSDSPFGGEVRFWSTISSLSRITGLMYGRIATVVWDSSRVIERMQIYVKFRNYTKMMIMIWWKCSFMIHDILYYWIVGLSKNMII